MRRMLNQNSTRRISKFRIADDVLYKSSFSKNDNFRIALQLYYINKTESKKVARLPKNDFRRVVLKSQKEVSSLRRLINQLNFDFAQVFVQKIIYR
jgi:hypothetical protein